MDAISDRNFYETPQHSSKQYFKSIDETPSLLTILLDLNPREWQQAREQFSKVISCLVVVMNSHLALNSNNSVSLFTYNGTNGSCKIWPPTSTTDETADETKITNKGIYQQFLKFDNSILSQLTEEIESQPATPPTEPIKGTLVGSLCKSLGIINKYQKQEAMMKSRVLIVNVSEDKTIPYIPMMNSIFAAQKMKVNIDVCQLGGAKSIFLQQASDTTNGIYLNVDKHLDGLIQYMTSAMFIDPSLREFLILPTNSNIDFRASCFVTNEIIDIGYVCSVCLCILSMIPDKCPTCGSEFDSEVTERMRKKPKVLPLQMKKKKTTGQTTATATATPEESTTPSAS